MKSYVSTSDLWNGIDWVRTCGTPRQAGVQHGEALRSLAHFQYRALGRLDHCHLTPEREQQLRVREEWLRSQFPAEVEEIHGIAEATGVDPLVVLLLCHQLGRRFGGRITFEGYPDIQMTVPTCDRARIRADIAEQLRWLATPRGGYLTMWEAPRYLKSQCQADDPTLCQFIVDTYRELDPYVRFAQPTDLTKEIDRRLSYVAAISKSLSRLV
jgi:hypothetical protein